MNTNFSAKFGKLGITVNYGAGGNFNLKGSSSSVTTPHAQTSYTKRELRGQRTMPNFWNFGNAELNYELDSLNTISTYGNIGGGSNCTKLEQTIITDYPSQPSSTSFYNLKSKNNYPNISTGLDFIRKFSNNKEREFSIRLNGEFADANTLLPTSQLNPGTDRFIDNCSIAGNKQYTIQTDYVHPLKNNQTTYPLNY
ncbi:MAG: hypothetical protein C4308_05095 [Chitinophagaceae bacterium]